MLAEKIYFKHKIMINNILTHLIIIKISYTVELIYPKKDI